MDRGAKLNGSRMKLIASHAAYWTGIMLFFTLLFSSRSNFQNLSEIFWVNLAYLPGGMAFAYFSIYYLIPQYIYTNRLIEYGIYQSLTLLLYPTLSQIVATFVIDPYITHELTAYSVGVHFSRMITIIITIVPLASVRIAKQIVIDNDLRNDLEHQKLDTELKYKDAELKLLKAQLQPHFLFNTLNGLYSLTIAHSEKAPEVILKLSDLLRYIIYEGNSDRVSLEQEMQFIRNYIDLERLRYDESLRVTIESTGSLHYQVAPLLLFTFVENSFKHGASKDIGSPWITIVLSTHNDSMTFIISNPLVDASTQPRGGIGIENVRNRLNLLYPGRHTLQITEERGVYTVSLHIEGS